MSFINEKLLNVDLSRLKKDILAEDRKKLLGQFQSKKVFDQLLQVFAICKQELWDASFEVINQRTVSKAKGVNLDIIGEIVGATRGLSEKDQKIWFTPDNAVARFDVSSIWVQNDSVSDVAKMSDDDYRRVVVSKIFKNYARYGSIPELIYFCELLTGKRVSFRKTGPLSLRLVVPEGMPPATILTLLRRISGDDIDNYYYLPLPPTVELESEVEYIASKKKEI